MLTAQLVGWDSAQESNVLEEPLRQYHIDHDKSRKETSLKEAASSACACFTLLSFLTYSSTLNLDVFCSSETSVGFQRIT
jgi:hypothetical protein